MSDLEEMLEWHRGGASSTRVPTYSDTPGLGNLREWQMGQMDPTSGVHPDTMNLDQARDPATRQHLEPQAPREAPRLHTRQQLFMLEKFLMEHAMRDMHKWRQTWRPPYQAPKEGEWYGGDRTGGQRYRM